MKLLFYPIKPTPYMQIQSSFGAHAYGQEKYNKIQNINYLF